MKDTILSGRLGIVMSKELSPCCGGKLLKWNPRMIGDKATCSYCGNSFHAIKSDTFHDSQYTGQCLETAFHVKKSRDIHLSQVWFSKKNYMTANVCKSYLDAKNIPVSSLTESDDFYCYKGMDCVEGSERVIYISKGILGVVGLEKDAMGASDFVSGGALNPEQGINEEDTTTPEETTTSLEDLVKDFFPVATK